MAKGPFVYSYKNLWKYLETRGESKTDFCNKVRLSSATLAKMNKHEKIAESTLKRICEAYGFTETSNIYEFKSDMMVWLDDINDIVESEGYTLYRNEWPKFVFYLTEVQAQFLRKMGIDQLNDIIRKAEIVADEENKPNFGIIGSTEFNLVSEKLNRLNKPVNKFVLQGSFAVIKKVITFLFLSSD